MNWAEHHWTPKPSKVQTADLVVPDCIISDPHFLPMYENEAKISDAATLLFWLPDPAQFEGTEPWYQGLD